jgi:hypothetical protein
VPSKPEPQLAESQARRAGTLKSALRPLANARIFERKSAALDVEPLSPADALYATHAAGLPSELSSEDFAEIVDVFRILKRWRDEARRGGK